MFWNRLMALGTGCGIAVRGPDLVVALAKVRWKGVTVAAKTTLRDFRKRPAAEWGEEYRAFLRAHGFRELPAVLALPRGEVIVRLLSLPAVAGSELRSAVHFQIDGLHPYGEDNVYYGFAPLERRPALAETAGSGPGPHRSTEVAVVIAARAVVDGYADLFTEAGVKLRGMTVAAAGYHSAVRLVRGTNPEPFLIADRYESGFELYGESAGRAFFSACFGSPAMPVEKAIAAAAAELRLPEDDSLPLVVCGERGMPSPLPAEQVLGSPLQAPPEFDLARDATAFAVAVSAAAPRFGWRTNLLPAERRSSSARWPIAATAASGFAAALVALLLWLRGPIQDRRYALELQREVKRLEAVEREVKGFEQQAQRLRARRARLESFRRRAEADLAMITEISRQLPKTVWLNSIEVNEASVQLTGQADAAAPLLSLLDNSGVLTGAAFSTSITRNESREVFRIRAARKPVLDIRRPAPGVTEVSQAHAIPFAHGPGPQSPASGPHH
jgi:Tfp pilus assembly protein PilN